MKELFLFGDPRFLSGGSPTSEAIDYCCNPRYIDPTTAVTSKILMSSTWFGRSSTLPELLGVTCRQEIHKGRFSYHHRPKLNKFLISRQSPSVGVELELEERSTNPSDKKKMENELVSNWFHFESDSSLHTVDREGYELITEPLPPRAYRDPRLWAGLQNILTPWLESFSFRQTGLHVHVGVDMFEQIDSFPLQNKSDRRTVGKTLSAILYFLMLPRTFVDKVMLRNNTCYCAQPTNFTIINQVLALRGAQGKLTGHDLINQIVQHSIQASQWVIRADAVLRDLYDGEYTQSCHDALLSNDTILTGHHVEINMAPKYTIEFRRGKGTLNSMSIHRMVELATLVVRYAWKIMREPDTEVTTKNLLNYISQNTTSPALRTLALQELAN